MFAYYAGWADKLHGEVIPVPSGHLNYTLREPLGVVFQITPWNAPIFTAGWQIAPAIATGNGVVIKPSELTPVTTRVAMNAAAALKPAVLELGGKSANIVFGDANLEHACLGAQAAIFSGAGQSCVAGSRLLVHESVHSQFIDMLSTGMNNITLGDPLDERTEIGPISNAKQFAHVTSMIGEAADAYFVPPTVLSGLSNAAKPAQEEIFGPVVTAIPFEDEAQAIAIANDTSFGLAGAVWTADVGRAHRVADAVRAGTFWINSYKAIHVSSPFGGSLNSGFGRSSGTDALMEYTSAKSVWLDSGETPKIAFGYVS